MLPSPSLGPPLLSPSWSPPLFCGMPPLPPPEPALLPDPLPTAGWLVCALDVCGAELLAGWPFDA